MNFKGQQKQEQICSDGYTAAGRTHQVTPPSSPFSGPSSPAFVLFYASSSVLLKLYYHNFLLSYGIL